MPRLFTVVIRAGSAIRPGTGDVFTWFEADFANIHFARTDEADVIRYVREAARHIYGPKTQVIFLHKER